MQTQVRIVPWPELGPELIEAWSRMVVASRHNPSLDPRWLRATLESQGAANRTQVAAAYSGQELVAVLPFLTSTTRTFGIPLRTIDLATNLISYHAEIVGADAAPEVIHDVLRQAHAGGWDLLRASNIPDDSPTAGLLRAVASELGASTLHLPGDQSPYLEINSDWDTYLRTRDTKFRANQTRAIRRMREAGETDMQWFIGSDDHDELLDAILQIEQKSWKAKAGTAITSRPVELDYHRRLMPALAELNALYANVLYVHHEPAAYVLCCRFHGWIGQLKTSFDEQFQHAGARVIDESVKRAFDDGCRTYDFLGDAAPHKLKWTSKIRPHIHHWIYSKRLPARLASTAKVVAGRTAILVGSKVKRQSRQH